MIKGKQIEFPHPYLASFVLFFVLALVLAVLAVVLLRALALGAGGEMPRTFLGGMGLGFAGSGLMAFAALFRLKTGTRLDLAANRVIEDRFVFGVRRVREFPLPANAVFLMREEALTQQAHRQASVPVKTSWQCTLLLEGRQLPLFSTTKKEEMERVRTFLESNGRTPTSEAPKEGMPLASKIVGIACALFMAALLIELKLTGKF